MKSLKKFTLCALFYGDYYSLATRCLEPLRRDLPPDTDLRVATNAACERTKQYIDGLHRAGRIKHVLHFDQNAHKYPAMRALFQLAPLASYTMWFDDDSYVTRRDLFAWLDEIAAKLDTSASMVGSIYGMAWQGNQREWIKAQPWYRGKDPALRPAARFCTGGWWAIRSALLTRLDYPWRDLDHNGGDVMLGEAIYQSDGKLETFRDGVCINADEVGRESKALRRGFTQKPVGYDYVASSPKPEPAAPAAPVLQRRPPFLDLGL